MHRYINLFFGLAISFATAQAQSITALNTTSRSTEPVTTSKAPRKTNATESPFYIKLYGFYSLLTPGSQVSTSYSSSSTGTNTSFKNNSKGLGAGPRAGIGVGIIVSDFINLGIDADMLFGATLTSENNYNGTNYTSTGNTNTTFRVLSITPNITFKALSRPTYYIYNRLGLVGGVVLDYKVSQSSLYAPTTGASTKSESQYDYRKNSLSIGYQAALGIQFRLSQSLRGFAEVVAYNQSFRPKEDIYISTSTKSGVVTKYSSISQFNNQGDYTTTKQDGIDVNQSASYNVVMNSVGLGVGLLFRF
ncbi:hypothetical protein [Spirosoma flavum]|uniref:Outer membrane protein beta-barrel domain-containing protein n=1 Tax=Spirosoma flavum TaxID=2048557 RepID=A0ABW6AFK3_9BACT